MALNVYYPFLHVQFQILSLGVHMVPLGVHLDTQVALKNALPTSLSVQFYAFKTFYTKAVDRSRNVA
jgi:hypothetical protein